MPTVDTFAKSLFAAVPVALLAACGSAPQSPTEAGAGAAPMVYVSSARSPSSIATCLEDRLSRVRTSRSGDTTRLAVGPSSNESYFVMLTPSGSGSVVEVEHSSTASNDPPEEQMRFAIARCTT